MSLAGTLEHFENFYSKHVDFRNVDVWFPPGYEQGDERYPVLYMHDGQNIFDHPAAFGGESWRVDQAMTRLIDEGKVRACDRGRRLEFSDPLAGVHAAETV